MPAVRELVACRCSCCGPSALPSRTIGRDALRGTADPCWPVDPATSWWLWPRRPACRSAPPARDTPSSCRYLCRLARSRAGPDRSHCYPHRPCRACPGGPQPRAVPLSQSPTLRAGSSSGDGDCCVELGLTEVGPCLLGEVDGRARRLPQHEVGDAPFTRGAHHDVDGRKLREVHVRVEIGLIH